MKELDSSSLLIIEPLSQPMAVSLTTRSAFVWPFTRGTMNNNHELVKQQNTNKENHIFGYIHGLIAPWVTNLKKEENIHSRGRGSASGWHLIGWKALVRRWHLSEPGFVYCLWWNPKHSRRVGLPVLLSLRWYRSLILPNMLTHMPVFWIWRQSLVLYLSCSLY